MENCNNYLRRLRLLGAIGLVFLMCASVAPMPAFAADEELDECEDPDLQQAITQNTQAYVAYTLQAEQEAVKTRQEQFELHPMQFHSSIKQTMCISKLQDAKDLIAKKFSIKSALQTWLDEQLLNLAESACNYVNSNLQTALQNALNLMCIPIPDLGFFSISLPSLEKTTCNGLSLRDFMQYKTMPATGFGSRVPELYLSAPLIRGEIDLSTDADGLSTSW